MRLGSRKRINSLLSEIQHSYYQQRLQSGAYEIPFAYYFVSSSLFWICLFFFMCLHSFCSHLISNQSNNGCFYGWYFIIDNNTMPTKMNDTRNGTKRKINSFSPILCSRLINLTRKPQWLCVNHWNEQAKIGYHSRTSDRNSEISKRSRCAWHKPSDKFAQLSLSIN